jgi:hypothetical protein
MREVVKQSLAGVVLQSTLHCAVNRVLSSQYQTAFPLRQHCFRCVYSSLGKALEIVLAHRLRFGGRGSNATQLRAYAEAGGGLAEE